MKLVATILVAAFVVAGGMSFAFADCAGHTKAQLVQIDAPQVSSDRQVNNEALVPVPDKVAQQTKTSKDSVKK
jgi:hypothetical protein